MPLIFIPNFGVDIANFLETLFGKSSSRFIGKLIVFLLGVPIYFMVKHTIGSKESYKKIIVAFQNFDKVKQEKISKKGIVYFLGTVFLFIICLVVVILKTYL